MVSQEPFILFFIFKRPHYLSLADVELNSRPGWPWTHRGLSTSAFGVLRLKTFVPDTSFWFRFILFLLVCIVCVYTCVCRCQWRPEKNIRPSEAGVTNSREPLDGSAGNQI